MQNYPNGGPSAVWVTVHDIFLTEDSPTEAVGPSPVAAEHLLSSRRRVEQAVAAARAELLPHIQHLTVTVDPPDHAELIRALDWIANSSITPAEACEKMGVTVPEPDLVGWISPWPVTARSSDGSATITCLIPATPPAELAVDTADWLQTALADDWITDPVPPCPGHPHPMRPAVHDATAWWECPANGPVRAWRKQQV
ncbi:hypothetical protein CC117_27245 [Parafrankia colletiae]|uniref:Uncharacterized protein n=1 Tax=Parafrankia colletiae TaxID=573497 RepID=A0A1S1QBZ5_9ACTN|nr:hypothetical protein [Parafrankia colletiae]OHV30991.1 hypothetical protein CC117_27245 [Parafrankia colletiae]